MKTYALLGFFLGLSLALVAQKPKTVTSTTRPLLSEVAVAGIPLTPNTPLSPAEKEISVVTGILTKLIQQEFNNGDTAINLGQVKGTYIAGSGVLIAIEQRNPFYSNPMLLGLNNQAFSIGRYGLTSAGNGQFPAVVGVTGMDEATSNSAKVKAKATENGQFPEVFEVTGMAETTAKSPKGKGKVAESPIDQPAVFGTAGMPGALQILGDSIVLEYFKGTLNSISTNGSLFMLNNSQGGNAKTQDSIFATKVPRMKKVLEKFLAEYTILLSKLKPEEKIWINWSIKEDYWGVDQHKMNCEFSSRITKQDMLDLRAGKLDQTRFNERIQYVVTRCAERITNPELEVFTAILERLYSPEVSQNLVQFGAVQAETIGGFGYVFKLNFMPGLFEIRQDGLTGTYRTQPQIKESSKQELEDKLKAFKTEFPQQLLEYSRVLNGLQPGEILKVDVTVGENDRIWSNASGEGSKKISYALPQALIRDYDTGKLRLEDALKLILIEEK